MTRVPDARVRPYGHHAYQPVFGFVEPHSGLGFDGQRRSAQEELRQTSNNQAHDFHDVAAHDFRSVLFAHFRNFVFPV